MNKDSIIDFWGYVIVRTVGILLGCVPLRLALWIGRRGGDLAYLLNSKRRSIAYANLKSAFPEKNRGELRKILRLHYQNLGMSVIELLKLSSMGKGYLTRHIKIDNFERVENSLSKGKGVILLSAHFGNWEVSSLACRLRGRPISVFAREQKYVRLNNLLNKCREMTGCKVVTKGFSARDIIRTLRDNGIVGVLADQDAGPNGVFINFFNRPASVAQGPVSFALKTGALIVPSFIRRVGFCEHVVATDEPLELINTGDKDEEIKANLEKITQIIEGYIKRYPDQWLWSHKRWKSTPHRRVLVLSDGKAGHRNQAVAVAEMIEEALGSRLEARGIKEKPVVKIHVVELEFKNRLARILLDVASIFARPRCQGCLRCLRFCLKKKTLDEIKDYADIIISCGASTTGANAFLKYENNAKAVVIMKSGLGRKGKFDLVILPRHDAPKRLRPNMMITEVAPNRIIQGHKVTPYHKGTGQAKTQSHKGVGLLIGGDAKNFSLDKETIEEVVNGILKIADEMDLEIFVSTSRRTSPEIERLLKEKLANHARCKLLVIANENNKEGVVQEIFDQSEVIIVSPESISMISEAASAAKHVLVFRVKGGGCPSTSLGTGRVKGKYGRVAASLEREGYIKTAAPEEISDTIKQILIEQPVVKKLNDRENIIQRLEAIM